MQVSTQKELPQKNITRRLSFSAFAFLALSVCVWLGFWQLDRAEEKRQLLDAPQILLTTLNNITLANLHQPIRLSGYFDNEHPILLDNQINNKQAGYHLYLPFTSQHRTILVNLGWIRATQQRSQLPKIKRFEGDFSITGNLSLPQGSPLLLGDNAMMTEQGVLRVQKTVTSDIQSHIPYELAPLLLQLDNDTKLGFIKNWTITVMPPEKHIAYAVQWFALGAAIFVSSIIWLKTKF